MKILCVLSCILAVCYCTFHYVNYQINDDKDYYVYEGKTLSTEEKPAAIYDATGVNDCIYNCPLHDSTCKYVLIKKQADATWQCQVYQSDFDLEELKITTYPTVTYLVTKSPIACSGSCKQLKDLCDKRCSCLDGCATGASADVLSYTCDCRNKDLVEKDCLEFRKLGFERSGIFLINPDNEGDDIEVFCEMNSDGSAYVTMLRRFMPLSMDKPESPFFHGYVGDFLKGVYWLNLDAIHRITKSSMYILSMELTSYDGNIWHVHWNGFSIADEADDYRLSVASYNDHGTGMEDLFLERNDQPWKHKQGSSVDRFWLNKDSDHESPLCCDDGIYLSTADGGKYSRIVLRLHSPLSGKYRNLALEGVASLSSDYYEDRWKAFVAVDGFVTHDINDGSGCTHTLDEFGSWFALDLLRMCEIDEVVIYNRITGASHVDTRTSGFLLSLYVEENGVAVSEQLLEMSYIKVKTFTVNVSARYIRVHTTQIKTLSICEFEVYGR